MNRINEAIQKRIDGANVARREIKKDTVVAVKPTSAEADEVINLCADKYDDAVDERQKATDGIVPDEKQQKAHLDESLFEDADEEEIETKEDNEIVNDKALDAVKDDFNTPGYDAKIDGDVYAYAYKTLVEDNFGEDRVAIASDHDNLGDYDIGIYCNGKDGEEAIKDFSDKMFLFNNVIANNSDTATEFPYIHVVRIPDSVASTNVVKYKDKYEIR